MIDPLQEARQSALNELYSALGHAIAAWSRVELALALWFEVISGMPTSMANDVYFAHNSFDTKQRLVAEVFKNSSASEEELTFAHAVFAKADVYSQFRNQLAHWIAHVDYSGGSPLTKLINPRGNQQAMAAAGITAADIRQAAQNFGMLAAIMGAAHFNRKLPVHPPPSFSHRNSLPELLKRVQQLPNQASSAQPSLNQSRRERQLEAAARKNAQTRSKPKGS